MIKHLVLGHKGQVGAAVFEVLKPYDPFGLDRWGNGLGPFTFDVLHCCIPYSPGFNNVVAEYKQKYLKPGGLVIIHSTVPVGTSDFHYAVHSPIRGLHPNLVLGIQTFVKYFGGTRAPEAAKYFQDLGLSVWCTRKAETTEALKLWDTTYYGWAIIFEKAVKAYCDEHDLDFYTVYRHANHTYNLGYEQLGLEDVVRPVLQHKPGPIGGHCILPNAEILGGEIAEFILRKSREANNEGLSQPSY